MLRLIMKTPRNNFRDDDKAWCSYRVFDFDHPELEKYLLSKCEAEEAIEIVGFEIAEGMARRIDTQPLQQHDYNRRQSNEKDEFNFGKIEFNDAGIDIDPMNPPAHAYASVPAWPTTVGGASSADSQEILRAKLLAKHKDKLAQIRQPQQAQPTKRSWRNFWWPKAQPAPTPKPNVIPLP